MPNAWVNTTSGGSWAGGPVTALWYNINGGSWTPITKGWINSASGSNWQQFFPGPIPPSFGSVQFTAAVDAGEDGTSDGDNGCDCWDGSKYENEWCFQWAYADDCVNLTHYVQTERNQTVWVTNGNEFSACKIWQSSGWCLSDGTPWNGSVDSGDYLTTACPSWTSVTWDYRFKMGTTGMGTLLDTTSAYTLANCLAS